MGMKQLEAAILVEARDVTKRRSLRQKDILEWSTGDIKPQDGEKVFRLPDLGINVAISSKLVKA